MPRPIRKDLSYFTLDCDIFSKKADLRPLLRKFKADGLAVYIHILCDVYSTGYYFKPDDYDGYILDIAEDCGISEGKVKLILAFMADRTLLDAFSLNKNTVFTSHGIQKRYAEAMKGRKRSVAEIRGEHWLLSEEEEQEIDTFYKAHPKADKSENNADKSEIYPTNKIKGNKHIKTYLKEEENNTHANADVLSSSSFKDLGCVVDCEVPQGLDIATLTEKIRQSEYLREWRFLSKYVDKADKILAGYYDKYHRKSSEKPQPILSRDTICEDLPPFDLDSPV